MKAIVEIDIPSDYIDDYKKWLLDGSLYYLEDGDWTHLKNIECNLKPTNKVIPIEWIKKYKRLDITDAIKMPCTASAFDIIRGWNTCLDKLLEDWEKENENR